MARSRYFNVAGAGPFPTDMLRCGGARAVSPEDQAKIDRLSTENAPDLESLRTKTTIALVTEQLHTPTRRRWESHLWKVVD